jgi:hypothetical protein
VAQFGSTFHLGILYGDTQQTSNPAFCPFLRFLIPSLLDNSDQQLPWTEDMIELPSDTGPFPFFTFPAPANAPALSTSDLPQPGQSFQLEASCYNIGTVFL